jgi:ABC-type uncharacterized transport system ATPase subunit
VISDIATRRRECCVILTTHSMEECEALCTRRVEQSHPIGTIVLRRS